MPVPVILVVSDMQVGLALGSAARVGTLLSCDWPVDRLSESLDV
jgi:hypothetical protein